MFSLEELDVALSRTWEEVYAEGNSNRYAGVRGEGAFWGAFVNRVRGRLDGGSVSAACFERLAVHFRDASSWALYSDVEGSLDELARLGLPLGIVSNWDSHLPRLLEALGVARRFRAVAVSAIEQTGKPDAEIFLRVCARLDIEPARCLHVGDSRAEDFEGARAAGLEAFLLDREERHKDVPAKDRIRSLGEIAPRLTRERKAES